MTPCGPIDGKTIEGRITFTGYALLQGLCEAGYPLRISVKMNQLIEIKRFVPHRTGFPPRQEMLTAYAVSRLAGLIAHASRLFRDGTHGLTEVAEVVVVNVGISRIEEHEPGDA